MVICNIHDKGLEDKDGLCSVGDIENINLVAELHSTKVTKNLSTSKGRKHIVLDPFKAFTCKNSKSKQNKNGRNKKSKNKTRKASINDPYVNVIVDSGATRHCCNNLDIMDNIRNTNINIMVGNGDTIQATKMGDIGCIKDVLYLPEIKHFLFSISYILYTSPECRVEFYKDGFQLKNGRKIIARGVLADSHLYVLRVRLPQNYIKSNKRNVDKSLFIDLEKSNINQSQLKELQGNLPIKFEYI
jgi:hypothetical protein